MNKIITSILIGVLSCVAYAQNAPTSDEVETITTKLNSYHEQVKNMSLTDRTQLDAAYEAFVASNTDMIKKLYDFAMANPVDYRKWEDAYRNKNSQAMHIRNWLVFYKRANDEERAFTLEQLAVAFRFAEAWKPQHWAVVEQNYESMKSNGWKAFGYGIPSHIIFAMALRIGDNDAIIDLPENAIIDAGLEKYLPALEKACASLGTTKDDAKRAWLAYVRARRILSSHQSETKNSSFWSRLLADEDATYCDYKRM